MAALPVAVPTDPQRRLLAQLAAVFVRPLAFLPADVTATAFPSHNFSSLGPGHPFHAPVNRAVARALGLDRLTIDPALVERVEERPATRLCVLLVTEPLAALRDAGKHVAAAFLHKQVVGLVLKADRLRIRSILGEDAHQVAAGESALLHAPLIAANDLTNDRTILGDLTDEAAAQGRIVDFGLRILSRFVALTEPTLAALFDLRMARGAGGSGAVAALERDHCDHIVRLLRRRIPAWAPIIA